MGFENHVLTWAASILCCCGVVTVAFSKQYKSSAVYNSNLFLPTYTVGIIAWLLHGLNVNSLAIILPCAIQVCVLCYMLLKLVLYRKEFGSDGL